mmetsp:Transcript_11257/g.14210  ORF Transcript_11257/g.14210 Transcript_11257/m.14210 type:complete len:189 (+) Transcript_11257:1-567(+)
MAESAQVQKGVSIESTLIVGISCFVHCVVELLADSTELPISTFFRLFIYMVVCLNFAQAYVAAGGAIPSKLKYTFSGFCLYASHALLKFGVVELPELLVDIVLCQYYLMTLLAFMIHVYFGEIYSEPGKAKTVYMREVQGKTTVHIFTKLRAQATYKTLDKALIIEFAAFMTKEMQLLYLALLQDKLV